MSFLEADDTQQTLDNVLDFIDSFEDASDLQPAPLPKNRRVRSARSTSTALQRRQKAETLQLREQVAELQQELKRLRIIQSWSQQRDGNTALTKYEKNVQKIKRKLRYDQAMTEYQGRLQAEKDNRRLKDMLSGQKKFGEALRGLLQKQSMQEGLNIAQIKKPKVQRPLAGASQFMLQLEEKVERLYSRSGALFRDGQTSISSHTVITNDERRGKVIEMLVVTPMACSIKDAGNMVWGYFEESWDQGTHPNSLEKNYVTTATSTVGLLELEKRNYARRFKEPGRAVIAWANLIVLPEHKLMIHVQSSTVITCSDTNSVNTSVARSFVQLYSEPIDSCTRDHDTRSVRETVLAFAGDVFRQHFQSQQNQLIQKVGRMERTLPILA